MGKLYFWLPFLALVLVLAWRLLGRGPETSTSAPAVADEPPAPQVPEAVIQRVEKVEKLDRHELKVTLQIEVQPLDAPAYQTETVWVIRTGRIAALHLGLRVPISLDGATVRPAVNWAKLWHAGYTPPARD